MTELFPVEETQLLSPRLAWMQKHDVTTKYHSKIKEWQAWTGDWESAFQHSIDNMNKYGDYQTERFCCGETADEALIELCKANGWKLWNEEAI